MSSDSPVWISSRGPGVRLTLHVQPRASRTRIVGEHGDALKIAVQAPPVEGAANDEIVRFLARLLGVSTRNVRLLAGETGRRKVVEIDGVTLDSAVQKLR